MELKILSPNSQTVVQVDWVELVTTVGSMIVQNNHAPSIVALAAPSSLHYVRFGDTTIVSFPIEKSALAHVTRKNITVIVSQ